MAGDDLKSLEEKLAQFRAQERQSKSPGGLSPEEQARLDSGQRIGMRAGSTFVSHVLAGGVLGFGIDSVFHTKPLFIILFLFAGFGAALWRAQKIMNENG